MKKNKLMHVLPESRSKVQELIVSHPHYLKFDEYHKLDHQILRIRTGIELATDETLLRMKAHLLHLKDELYSMVKAN
ncbi:MAG: YdcH family protein [Flavobacterium sp.]|jgi:hypothetical protein